ncbi:uncharacterized protein BDZ83DRAFT_642370 [Colletotrichum acutatum]|uniref:Uncharacterized protein n=1 Tax=Glomerella acutata TaxID=27357 RepID=A0AAD8UAX7_GLOAC|nr:uncharacterized protein BDZ83DRAFT_642370 [Colletotrichum acutatum]KAK1708204.1 hypothetical protein BDZ83DRAFT_642370 [Colletotrichum acutatum]
MNGSLSLPLELSCTRSYIRFTEVIQFFRKLWYRSRLRKTIHKVEAVLATSSDTISGSAFIDKTTTRRSS